MQLNLFPLPTYAELCRIEHGIYFHCAVCFKKLKRGTGIRDKFCSEKHREVYRKWEKELKEGLRRFGICQHLQQEKK